MHVRIIVKFPEGSVNAQRGNMDLNFKSKKEALEYFQRTQFSELNVDFWAGAKFTLCHMPYNYGGKVIKELN